MRRVFYVVTVLTNQFEVFEIQCDLRIVYVLPRQIDFMMHDIADLEFALLSAAFAKTAVQICPRFVRVPACAPFFRIVKRDRVIFCHIIKNATGENHETPVARGEEDVLLSDPSYPTIQVYHL